MRITRIALLSMFPVALSGCEPGQTGEMAAEIEEEAPEVNAGQSLVADTLEVEAEADGAMQATVVLNELNGSGLAGDATVAAGQAGNQARVVVNLQGASDAGGVHQGHIHQGTCDSIGGVVVPLPPVSMAGGQGTATSTVAVDPMSVMDGNHIIVYHEAGGDPGRPVVCGEIPGHVM